MRVGALIVGIIGGLIALVIGQLGFALGSLIGFSQLKALSVILPIIALVGAGMVLSKPLIGAAMMALAGIVFIAILGFNFFTFIPVLLLFLAACLGLAGQGENKNETAEINSMSQLPPSQQITGFFCPVCGRKFETDYSGLYCENCGAQVRQAP